MYNCIRPPFSGDETLSNGDAFSAVAPDMDYQIGHPGWPALSSSALVRSKPKAIRAGGVNSRSQSLGSIEIAIEANDCRGPNSDCTASTMPRLIEYNDHCGQFMRI
jgi:hypothetical protein